jgi:hypothetical protein
MRRELPLILAALALPAACGRAPELEPATVTASEAPASSPAPARAQGTDDPVAAASALLATLTPAQREGALFPFDDQEQKRRWSNLPTGIFERRGLRLGDLAPPQAEAAHALLRAVLSPEGYRKVTEIMAGDEVLRARGDGGGRLAFGDDEYYLALLGTPSATAPWMVQFGGHHLAINVTLAGRSSVITPSLPATQPATFELEGRIVRPLGDEYDRAFALMGALDEGQRREAVLGFEVRDLVLGAGQDGRTIQPEGLRVSRMTAAQQEMLLELAGEWVNLLGEPGASARMAEIRASLADSWFAWSGPTEKGRAAYFRIQGPTLVIEYAPQGRETGTDQGVDHVHTIYRDPTNDYGARLVAR